MPYQSPGLDAQTEQETRPPRLYAVVFHNDDYTTMEFVVDVLRVVFHKNEAEAARLMMDVHKLGRAAVGAYAYDVAESRAARASEMAEGAGFPLRVTVEPEEQA